MRAHITTTRARTIVPGGIIALSLAVVLLAATASTASTTPAPPLTLSGLSVSGGDLDRALGSVRLSRQLIVTATTNNDSTLVARGDVKKTKKQLKAGESTRIKAKLKQSKWKRLSVAKEKYGHFLTDRPKPGTPKVKVKVKATDEFSQTATEEIKVWLCYNAPC